MSFKSLVLIWLCLAFSASALTTHSRRAIAHRAVARRATPLASVRRRADGKRCRPRTSSPSSPHSTTVPVANVAPRPTTSHDPKPNPTPKDDKPQTTNAPPPKDTPKPTQPPKDDPKTTHQPPPPPPPAPKPTPKPNTGGPSFMTGTQTGQGTFYATGLGACGITNKDTDYIAAVSHLLFDQYPGYTHGNPNSNPMCGRKVKATYQGKSVVVALTDRCEGCAITDLDFSPSAFQQLASFDVGRISGMTWVWV